MKYANESSFRRRSPVEIILCPFSKKGLLLKEYLIPLIVNKWTQELIQSDPHQVLNIKGKERLLKLKSHKKADGKQSWQSFLKRVTTRLPKLN